MKTLHDETITKKEGLKNSAPKKDKRLHTGGRERYYEAAIYCDLLRAAKASGAKNF